MFEQATVTVCIVTYNSSAYIRGCLDTVLRQNHPALDVVVIDNASADGTPDLLKGFIKPVRVVLNERNTGFAAGQNQAIKMTGSDWILCLNPDTVLEPDFVSQLLHAGAALRHVGTLCGKLRRMGGNYEKPAEPVLDSTGMFFTPNLRHFDRGSGELDHDQFRTQQYVFGATGAAALYRRTMIENVSIDNEFFDEDFFAYREDADVSWRAQLIGWRTLYVPDALAYHVRSVLPANRHQVSRIINMHSVKNRFLMRIKNITPSLYLKHLLAITLRDLLVVAGCLIRERSSLTAFSFLVRTLPRQLAKRRKIMQKRATNDAEMNAWFQSRPASLPAPVSVLTTAARR